MSASAKVVCKVVNNIKVQPVPQVKAFNADPRPVQGQALFGNWIYPPNIFCLARKRLGKTSVVMRIVKECALRKKTLVIVFCPTFRKDRNYAFLRQLCQRMELPLLHFDGLKDEGGVNHLSDIEKALIAMPKDEDDIDADATDDEASGEDGEGKEDKAPEERQCDHIINLDTLKEDATEVDENGEVRKKKKRKSKVRGPRSIVIFDDCSSELRSITIDKFVKIAGSHLGCMSILSSQWAHDISPQAWRQIDFCLCWKALTEDKLEKVFKNTDLHIDYELFQRLYHDATGGEGYHFLLIDVQHGLFKKDFNQEYEIEAAGTSAAGQTAAPEPSKVARRKTPSAAVPSQINPRSC